MKNIKISFFIFISSVITLTVNSIYAQESLSVRPNVIVVLTTVDWLDVFIDQQPQVSLGERKNSYWCLQVDARRGL